MNLLKNKIAAFSMVEMLVVMVMSSLAVSIIYSSYHFASAYHLRLTRKSAYHLAINDLYFLLKSDFEISEYVVLADSMSLVFASAEERKVVRYSFSSNQVLRQQAERTDKFDGVFERPVFHAADTATGSMALIDGLQVRISSYDPPLLLVCHKEYDAALLIRNLKTETP